MADTAPEPRWVSRLVIEAVHADMLLTHGGLPGLRDATILESALARPRQRHAHDPSAELADLAASYAFGIVRDHPFNDGNKRVGFVALAVFLGLNDLELEASESEVVETLVALSSGAIDESALAGWVREHTSRGARP